MEITGHKTRSMWMKLRACSAASKSPDRTRKHAEEMVRRNMKAEV